ncbi:protein of unknown function (plasmid) [Cupriavidus taiwanensis]|uniref:Uncharacterized protein n=1 Tax=Cupriavidus taiwanensis TaxID=164546 RepID=A0A375IRW6_9BURK|nr:protein of unknown function [Cupriavidus taiwanensis]
MRWYALRIYTIRHQCASRGASREFLECVITISRWRRNPRIFNVRFTVFIRHVLGPGARELVYTSPPLLRGFTLNRMLAWSINATGIDAVSVLDIERAMKFVSFRPASVLWVRLIFARRPMLKVRAVWTKTTT